MKSKHLSPHFSMRRKNRVLPIALLLGAVFALLLVQTAPAAVRTVTNINNSGTGSLRDAISKAVADDTIVFDPSLSGQTIILTSGPLNILKRITIIGPGAANLTISGNKKYRVFLLDTKADVIISGLTIANGYIRNQRGGGIYNAGKLAIDNSIITDCQIDGISYGGAGIYNKGSLKVSFCIIQNNKDKTYSLGGGGIYNDGDLTLEDSFVVNNQSHNKPVIGCYGGGGICNRGIAFITRSEISGNLVYNFTYGGGAGIYNDKVLAISHSVVRDNKAFKTFGSGIMNWTGGTADIEYTTISGNTTERGGGAIENIGTMTVMNSTIAHNKATGPQYGGGGICNTEGNLTLINSTLSNNSSAYVGGGIMNEGGNIDVIYTTLAGNTASTGGGIFNTGQTTEATTNLYNSIVAYSTGGDCLINAGLVSIITNTLIADDSCTPTFSGDPLLGSLQDNGGETATHALLPGSIAIDAAICSEAVLFDQRGIPRPSGIGCDLGAFEFQEPEPPPPPPEEEV